MKMLGGGGGLKFCMCVFFCATTIVFHGENLNNLMICLTQCTLFFQSFDFYCRIAFRALSVRCM